MPKLYHAHISTCSQKVRLGLAEKAVAFDGLELDLRAGDQHQPEYLKLNPNGVVPTLVNGSDVIIESTVINEYIDDSFSGPPLRPGTAAGRARMRLWTKRLDESVHGNAAVLSFSIAFRLDFLKKSEAELEAFLQNMPDPRRREHQRTMIQQGPANPAFPAACRAFDRLLTDMEAVLEERLWLSGEALSLADLGYLPYLIRLEHLNLGSWWDDKPRVSAWLAKMKSRPSYQTAIADWLSEPALDIMQAEGSKAWPIIRKILDR